MGHDTTAVLRATMFLDRSYLIYNIFDVIVTSKTVNPTLIWILRLVWIQPTISLEMPVPSQGHYGFHSFPVVDWFCLFIYLSLR
jgi:hypothetical protein